ncbi:MAG TPA: cytochrome c biogenesis CcdA family protein [Dehalococcoidia bacterium]|nr:cytochrome c biogenesis CcdA family protein [Dehalococcoidia bacterium]
MPEIAGVSLTIAFAAGLLSCLSPCALPMVPTYLGYLSGVPSPGGSQDAPREGAGPRLTIFYHALGFVAGFTLVFIAIGASVGLIGWFLRDNLDLLGKIAGVLMIFFGLQVSGILQIPWFERERRLSFEFPRSLAYARSILVGSAYAIGWTPCIGPTLGVILTLAAAEGSVLQGSALLGFYSLGMAVPFLAMGLAFNSVHRFYRRLGPFLGVIQIFSGTLLIVVGILVYTGSLAQINQYFGFGPGGLSGSL